MAFTEALKELVAEVAESQDLTAEQTEALMAIAEAKEDVNVTSATIEPDDDHAVNDAPLLPVLDEQKDKYWGLLEKADKKTKDAFNIYLKERRRHLTSI